MLAAVRRICVLLALAVIACVATASESVFFGPKTFLVEAGKPKTYGELISVDAEAACQGQAVFVLVVENKNVSSAEMTLNGTAVLSERDFGQNRALIEKPILLTDQSMLLIKLKGGKKSGSLIVSIRPEIPSPICGGRTLTLTAPAAGAVVATRRIVVTGTAAGPRDIGITVNGSVADLDLTRAGTVADPFLWSAVVPAEPGTFTVSATASTMGAAPVTVTRGIQFAPAAEWVDLQPLERSGPAPLSVTFSLSAETPDNITLYEVDLDGDGTYEVTSPTLPDDLSFTYPTPGPRNVAARVTTVTGHKLVATATIYVQSFAAIHALLQRQWTGFVTALASGSVDAALPYLAGDEAKQKYKRGLELIRPTLANFAAGIGTIEPVWISGHAAHYLLTRTEGPKVHGYHVYFVRDLHGVWRIAQF